ncbi:MAG: hypothetical protein ITG01_06350 [Comamonas sp.]|nr:hypothetical protein [Comamonas sp.]
MNFQQCTLFTKRHLVLKSCKNIKSKNPRHQYLLLRRAGSTLHTTDTLPRDTNGKVPPDFLTGFRPQD